MTSKFFFGFVVPCLLSLVLFAGCSNKCKVQGKVLFEDGTPLTKGEVAFETPTFIATGAIKSDGSYSISSVNEGDGIPPGTYSITVKAMDYPEVSPDALKIAKNPSVGPPKPLVDMKFATAATSGLTLEVKNSVKHDIKVTPPAK